MPVIRNLSLEEAARRLEDQERERLALNEQGGSDLFAGDYEAAKAELQRLERETNTSPGTKSA